MDVVLPQSSYDLEGLAAHREDFDVASVLVSGPETIRVSNDKAECYERLHELGIPAPAFRRVRGALEVEKAARELGYPERTVCFKPAISSGSRGYRVLDATADRTETLLYERPGFLSMRLEEAMELLPVEGGPDLLVMELAEGGERTIDGIADGSRVVLGHAKTRESLRAGLGMINIPYLGVARALGEISDEELEKLASRVRPGRTALRYFDQLEWGGEASS